MPRFLDDLDVAGSMTARAGAGDPTQTLRAAPGQTVPISEWYDADGDLVASVSPGGSAKFSSPQPTAPLGPELLGDPSFDTGAGWTAGTGWSISGGNAVAAAGATGDLSRTVTVTAGRTYQVEWSVTGESAGEVGIVLGTAFASKPYWHPGDDLSIVAAETGSVTFAVRPVKGWSGTLASVSLREVTGTSVPACVLADGAGVVQQEARGSATSVALGRDAQRSQTTGSDNNAFGSSAQYSQTTGSANNAFGYAAQRSQTTGSYNTAVGHAAQYSQTTSSYNNAFGSSAQYSQTTGSGNNAFGSDAQYSQTTGSGNNAFGYAAQYSQTTGSANNAFGYAAQYSPLGNTAYATTTGNRQTSIGHETGQNTATQLDDITTIGYRATAGANKGTALGANSRADHLGSVALGSDTATTAAGQVMVGPRDVEITDATKGVVLRSPNGTRYRINVSDTGTLTATAV